MLFHPTVPNNQLADELESPPIPRLAILGRERNRVSQLCAVARSRNLDAHEAALPLVQGEMAHCQLLLIDGGHLTAADRLWIRGLLRAADGKPAIVISEPVDHDAAADLIRSGAADVLDWTTLTSGHLARAVHLSLARQETQSRQEIQAPLQEAEAPIIPDLAVPEPVASKPAAPTLKPATGEANNITLLQECASALLLVDPEGIVKFANPEAEYLLGVPEGSLAGAPFALDLRGGEREEVLLDGPEGRQVDAEVRVVETEHGGVPMRVVTLQDMGLRHALERYFSA